MQQWDYSVLLIPTGDMQEMANELAAAGADGFELVGVMPAIATPAPVAHLNGRGVLEQVNVRQAPVPCVMLYFKRPKAPTEVGT